MIFFAIIITSVYDRFAEGVSPVLITLLLISCKYSIWNLMCSQGEALSHFFRLHHGLFVWTARPHRGAIAAPLPLPNKKGQMFYKCSGEMGMVELTELWKRGCVRGSQGTLEGGWAWGNFLSRKIRVELDRQCWTDLNSILGPDNNFFPEGSNENDCSW